MLKQRRFIGIAVAVVIALALLLPVIVSNSQTKHKTRVLGAVINATTTSTSAAPTKTTLAGFGIGDSGDNIKALQIKLGALHYDAQNTDGKYTETEVASVV